MSASDALLLVSSNVQSVFFSRERFLERAFFVEQKALYISSIDMYNNDVGQESAQNS